MDAKQALDSVLHDRNGQCVVVMTMQVEAGVPHREILVYSNNERITQEVLNVLVIFIYFLLCTKIHNILSFFNPRKRSCGGI